MDTLLQTFRETLQNQFLSGGLVLMLMASLLALCRKLPLHLWRFLLRRFTIVIDVSNDDAVFAWLTLWLADHPYSKRARTLTASAERSESRGCSPAGSPDADLPQVLLIPAPGNHLLWYQRRLVWLSRERKEAAPDKGDSLIGLWKREVFVIRVIGRSQSAARRLLDDAREVAARRRQRKTEIFSPFYDRWQAVDERDPRPLSSVFLPEHQRDEVVLDIERFLSGKDWYLQRGIPWRRRYLFYGAPRSGKTSLICALAGHFRMNLYILSLGSPYLTDDSLMTLLASVPSRSFILLEDVDCAFNARNKSEDARNKLTFSGLLNALDGAASKEGSLVFMTTNHIERLDPALIGAGRADLRMEFRHATAEQANRMFCAYFPDAQGADGFGDKVAVLKWSMADVQNHLIEHKDSYLRALNSLSEKIKVA